MGLGSYVAFLPSTVPPDHAGVETVLCEWTSNCAPQPLFTPYGHGCGGATADGNECWITTYLNPSAVKVTVQGTAFRTPAAARREITRTVRGARSVRVLGVDGSPWPTEVDDRVLVETRPDASGRTGVLFVRQGARLLTLTATTPEEALELELEFNQEATAPN
jgi:hypothetical protein